MIFLADTLTDSIGALLHNHTGEIGATWTQHPAFPAPRGTIRFATTSRIYPNLLSYGNTPIAYLASGEPTVAEYDIEFTYRHLSGYGNFGVIFRASTYARTWYRVYHGAGSGSTQQWVLDKHVAGLITNLGAFNETLTPATSYPVKIECRDATKKVLVDYGAGWVERISTTDNQVPGPGRAGFYSAFQYADNEGKQIDDIVAEDLYTAPGGGGATRSRLLITGD